MIKRLFIAGLCASLPWLVMLLNDNPGAAFAALVLQATLIGWPVATIWAWHVQYPSKQKESSKED